MDEHSLGIPSFPCKTTFLHICLPALPISHHLAFSLCCSNSKPTNFFILKIALPIPPMLAFSFPPPLILLFFFPICQTQLDPQDPVQHWKCHVDRPTFLCDPDFLLERNERNEIQKLVENFPESTKLLKNKIGEFGSSIRGWISKGGIRLAIGLSHFPIGAGRHSPSLGNNLWGKNWPKMEDLKDPAAKELFDAIWKRFDEEKTEWGVISDKMVEKWKLGWPECRKYLLILPIWEMDATLKYAQIHIWGHCRRRRRKKLEKWWGKDAGTNFELLEEMIRNLGEMLMKRQIEEEEKRMPKGDRPLAIKYRLIIFFLCILSLASIILAIWAFVKVRKVPPICMKELEEMNGKEKLEKTENIRMESDFI